MEFKNLLDFSNVYTGKSNTVDSLSEGKYPFFDRSQIIKRSNKYLFDEEAIIVPGEGKEFIPRYYEGKFDLHQRAYAIVPNKGEISKFVYYAVLFKKKHFEKVAVGTTVKSLRLASFELLDIPYPPKEEQIIIEKIFTALDDKIEINNAIIANLEAQAQAIFKSWFIDFEPFQDGEFIDSELGMIPEGWEVVKANDWFTINIGKTPPRKESQWFSYDKKDVPWLSISDMASLQTYIVKTSEYLTKEAVDKYNIKIVPTNSVLLSFKLTVGRVAITREEITTNEAISHFHINCIYELYFLYLYLKSFNYENLGNTSSIGRAINSKIIKEMPLLQPKKEILKVFHSLMEPYFDMIYALVTQNQNLAQLRDTLLPKLMSGEIRVGQESTEALENVEQIDAIEDI